MELHDSNPTGALWASMFNLAGQFAPRFLQQPILPGWVFANSIVIDEHNSRDPATERRIVARESYGRQLGVIIDAVDTLIQQAPPMPKGARGGQPATFEAFDKMRQRIDAIKAETRKSRFDTLRADLHRLKVEDPDAFEVLLREFNPR